MNVSLLLLLFGGAVASFASCFALLHGLCFKLESEGQ